MSKPFKQCDNANIAVRKKDISTTWLEIKKLRNATVYSNGKEIGKIGEGADYDPRTENDTGIF